MKTFEQFHLFRSFAKLGVFLVAVLFISGCGSDKEEFDPNPKLEALEVQPASVTLDREDTAQLSVIASFDDGTVRDVTDEATWTSDNATVVDVNDADEKGLVTASASNSGDAQIIASYLSEESTAVVSVRFPDLESLEITASSFVVNVGETQQFSVTGVFADGSEEDLTDQVTWGARPDPDEEGAVAVATVDNETSKGLVSANENDFGQITLTATASEIEATATVSVGACDEADPAITEFVIEPAGSLTLSVGDAVQFEATATYCSDTPIELDRTQAATWVSDAVDTITIDDSGSADAVGSGNARITGLLDDSEATTLVTVGGLKLVQVTPGDARVAEGLTIQLSANAIRSDNTREDVTEDATWESADASVATVGDTAATDKGLVTAGSIDGDAESSVKVFVTATVIDENGNEFVGRRRVEVLNVTLTSIGISTSSADVAPDDDLALGLSRQYVATGFFTVAVTGETFEQDLTEQVTWASDCAAVSIGANTGLATGELVSAEECPTPIVDPDTDFAALTASIDYDGATVTSSDVEVRVTDAVLVDGTLQINTDDGAEVAVGQQMQFTATGDFTDGVNRDVTADVTWGLSDNTVAAFEDELNDDDEKVLEGLAVGETTVMATYNLTTESGTQGTVNYDVTVTDAVIVSIEVNEGAVSQPKGVEFNYTATATYSDDSTGNVTETVTWVSSDTNVAVISNAAGERGLVTSTNCDCPFDEDTTAFETGITASAGGVTSPEVIFSVTAATLVSLEVTPNDEPTQVEQGQSIPLTATATFSDDTTSDVTADATWTTDSAAIATVGNSGNSKGVVFGEQADPENNATITASYTLAGNTQGNSVEIQVLPPVLEAILVENDDDSGSFTVANGGTLQLRVTAFFEDGSDADVTDSAVYASTNTDVATVDENGLVAGQSPGTATLDVSFTSGDVTESAFQQVTVE